jgi:anti-sigma28 factor (negative regulator of flagellin synthesis)
MNINQIGPIPKHHLPGTSSSPQKGDGIGTNASTDSRVSTSSVISELIARLTSATDESRLGLVNEIKSKVQSGEYLTRQQAEVAADAILDG